jgi:hypothetical protein
VPKYKVASIGENRGDRVHASPEKHFFPSTSASSDVTAMLYPEHSALGRTTIRRREPGVRKGDRIEPSGQGGWRPRIG